MAYGIEVYKDPGYPTLLDTMLGGRVFIELLEISPTAGNIGNINVGQQTSLVYSNVPGGQYLKYYTLQAGQYTVATSTNGSSQAVLTITRQSANISSRGTPTTIIALFATKINDPSYGFLVTNASGDRLVSSSYVIPVFKGRVTFNSTATYSYGLNRVHEKTISYGDTNSYKLVLYTIPQSTNVWFTAESFIYPGINPYTLTTTYSLPSAGTTYNLAEAFVFQLNNISASSHSYGIRVWDSGSPQKLTFDSGLEHINIAGIQESPKISFDNTEQSITNSSLYGDYSAIVIPRFYRETAQQTSQNALSSTIRSYNGVFRRQAGTLYYKIQETGLGFEDAVINYTYEWGSQYDNTIFIVNTSLLGGTGGGGSGSNTLTATISEGGGSSSCTYSTEYSSNCTTSKTYNINTSGGDGTNITYNWSIIENTAGFTLTTASNLGYATISHTGSSGTYAAIIRCTLTQSGVSTIIDYPIQHTHSTVAATYTVTANTNSINEGQGVTFVISTTNVPPDTTLYWTLNSITGTDLSPTQSSGSFTIGANLSGYVTLYASEDELEEGTESFSITIRTGSTSGTDVGTSPTVTIVDTSTPSSGWSLYLSDSSTSINGGSTKTLVLSYFDIGVQSLPTYSFSSNNANLTISNSSGTMNGNYDSEAGEYVNIEKQVTITAANINGGNQSVIITARSPNGGTVRRLLSLTINDVQQPTVTLTPASSSISINTTTTITVTTSESTTSLTSGDVTVSSGSISNFSGSGTSYSFTYTAPGTGGTATISIAAGAFQDSVGNNNTAGSTSITIVAPTFYDAPQISNFTANPSSGQNETTQRSVTFSFDVTDNSYSYNQRYNGSTFIGTNFYWAIEGNAEVSGDDFDSSIYGTLQSVDGTVNRSASITIKTDQLTETGTQQYRVNFYRNGPYTGTPYYQSSWYTISDTSTTPVVLSYNVSPSSGSVSEGSALNFNITTSNVPDGTTLYWTLSGTNINGIDYNETQYQSAISTTNTGGGAAGYATIVHQLYQKHLGRFAEQGGLDYWVGQLVANNDSVAGVENNIAAATIAGNSDSGSVIIYSNSATVSGSVVADITSENTETFTFSLRTGSTSGPVVKTATVTVSDSSTPPSSPSINSFSASPSSITNGSSTTLSWSTSGANVVKISGVGTYNASTTSISVSPSSTTTYTLTAINVAGQATSSTTVTVTEPVVQISGITFSPSPVNNAGSYTVTVSQNITSTSANQITLTFDQRTPNGSNNIFSPPGHLITIPAGSTSGSFSSTVSGADLRHNAQLTATGSISTGSANTWAVVGGNSNTGVSYIDYNVSNTADATKNTQNTTIFLRAGQVFRAGTANVGGYLSQTVYVTTGDSYIVLVNSGGTIVAFNDDYTGFGTASYFEYTVPSDGNYTLKLGAYKDGASSGRAGYIFG